MKKFLLLISCLFALGTTSALADSYKWETSSGSNVFAPKNGDTNPADFKDATLSDATWKLNRSEKVYLGANWSGKNNDWKGQQFGKNGSSALPFSISTDYFNNKSISEIKINASGETTVTLTVKVGNNEFGEAVALESTSKSGTTYTFQGNASGNLEIAYSGTTTKAVYFRSIEVTYTTDPVTPSAVETPEIAIDDKNFVSITCATDGADIYYTLNGDVPTAESQKYEAPFELTASATVKAIAIKGEDQSNVASKTFTVVEKKSSLAGWTEWTENATFNITCPLTVVYKNGNNIYVKDAENNFALVYNQDGITLPDYVNGNVINGMTAKFIVYAASKLPELIPATVGEMTAGEAVEPVEITAADVTAENFFHYVKISGISVVAGKSGNFTLTDKEGTDAAMYNQFKLDFTPEEGAVYNAVGVIGAFKGTYQFQPIEITRALPDGALDFTTVDVEDSFAIGKDDDSATITVSGVHAESELYYKFTAAPAETAPEAAPRKVVDHTGYTKAVRNADGTHTIAVSEAGTLELYAYHPATDTKGDVKTIAITKDGTTAIDSIGTDVAEGEAEYFNLQGVKVDRENAAPGLYIRRQGSKVAKVIVK